MNETNTAQLKVYWSTIITANMSDTKTAQLQIFQSCSGEIMRIKIPHFLDQSYAFAL